MERNGNLSISEALVGKVLTRNAFNAIDDVLCYLIALHQLQHLLKVFALAFFHSDIVDFGNAWLCAQLQFEPSLVATGFEDLDASLCKEALSHKAFDSIA